MSCAALLAANVAIAIAQRPGAFNETFNHPAIKYPTTDSETVVDALNRRIAEGSAALKYEDKGGYLKSVLELLDIPVESQVLVYTQTSQQAKLITMQNPRAIYFNDHVSVGFVRGGGILEIVAQDPGLGSVFYVVHQEVNPKARFGREQQCLRCHLSWDTLGVPGQMILSTFPRKSDNDYANGFTVNQYREIGDRWGGWYVTGKRVPRKHMGNLPLFIPKIPDAPPPARASLEGQFDLTGYPTPYSDVAALMVLEHQAHLLNLLTWATWETRVGNGVRASEAAETIADYMLFVDEAPIVDGPIVGSAGFEAKFLAAGKRDSKGRSLRELDLRTRLQKYPLSYMIHSPAFASLPASARNLVIGRIDRVLAGEITGSKYAHLGPEIRAAITEILRETLPTP